MKYFKYKLSCDRIQTMKKLVIFCFVIDFVFASGKFARVDVSKGVIQLGVFRDMGNVKKLQKRFDGYNFFVKKFPNHIKKVYIINIKKSSQKLYLEKVKRIVPHAFLLNQSSKLKVFKNLTPCMGNIPPKNPNIKQSTQKSISFEDTSCLDSKAIIKTRKKFFK